MSSAPAPPAPGVTFEVERFEWAADDRLELVGRWFGLRGHRFLRPTLDVEVAGERRRMLAVLEHKPWAAEDGEEWIAAFPWTGEPARLEDAELTVSPDLAVQLPLPDVADDSRGTPAPAQPAERRAARRPRTAVLEDELAAAMAEITRLTEQLARERELHSEAGRELRERARLADQESKRLEAELEQATGRLATAEAHAESRLEAARKERDAATAARDEAIDEASAARAERDAAMKKLAAAEAERDAMADARDRAREERNAWMSRARAAASEARGGGATAARVSGPRTIESAPTKPLPEATQELPARSEAEPGPEKNDGAASPSERVPSERVPSERRTIQIGERPGPLRPAPLADSSWPSRTVWTPRLIAIVALAVFVVLVVLLLLFAL
jgi:hypothetical protein